MDPGTPPAAPGPGAPRHPLDRLPPLPTGGRRRTMHVDVGPRTAWAGELPMAGGAWDVDAAVDGRPTVTVRGAAAVTAGFDAERRLTTLATTPPVPWADALLGGRAGGGFRRHLDDVIPPSEDGSLLRQVLDDLPAAALISGYGWMRVARRAGADPASLTPPEVIGRMVDLCSGWRSDGAAMTSVAAGGGVPIQDCPPAPPLTVGDGSAWPGLAPLGEDWMRRRRLIDVTVDPAGGFGLWSMFRDTVGVGGGAELVLHEYVVTAAGSGTTLTSVEAEPRVLPFGECPGAVAAVGDLAGFDLAALGGTVGATLVGVRSCTHLNDLLRSLAGAARLLAAA